MVIGGQRISQPLRYVVGGSRALKVARYFAEAGQLDKEEEWEEP
jgi:hypothetical protein